MKKNKDQIREKGKFSSPYKELGKTERIRIPVIMKNDLENLLLILEQEAKKMDKEMAVIKLKSMIENYFS